MEKYSYTMDYLKSLSRKELLALMFEHDYEEGYEELLSSELIEQLSRIVEA